jgi:hypothetical protein
MVPCSFKYKGTSGLRTVWHSTPFVSSGLRPPSLPHCAERHTVLSQPMLLVRAGSSVVAHGGSRLRQRVLLQPNGIQSRQTHAAGCRGQWGGWCSEVKEEDRAQPGPGDTNGTIYPAALGVPKLCVPTLSLQKYANT